MCEVDVIANLLVLYLPFCSTLNKNFFFLLCLFYLLMIIESLWIKSIWNLVQLLKRNRKCNLPLFCVALLDDDAYCYYPKSLNGKSGCLEVAKICIIYYK